MKLRPFRPRPALLLPGATLRDRVLAALGALAGIALAGAIATALVAPGTALLLVAPMGASAVLAFAVPASPLAQPWPVVGGNLLSALVGIAVAQLVPVPALAAGLAVAGAIMVMSLARCLHPPGGAAALLAVVGGPAVTQAGFTYALVPVGLNALLLTAAAVAFHRLSGHSYPHRARAVASDAAIERALAELDEPLDIDRDDLVRLIRRVEHHARR